jgi:lipoprotein LpqB-like beta-propeller protein/sporulation and spore germination protein
MSAVTRRCLATLLTAAAVLLPAGCVRLPEDGPVVETRSGGNVNTEAGIFIDPRPPQPGASAPEIVKGFLDAMTATPIQTNDAKQFLAKEAQASWNPQQQTITYADASPPRGGSRVSVTLTGGNLLDSRGAWQGRLPRSEHIVQFPMTREDGELRIAVAPDALIVPETWFAQRFRQVSLYFFDPTAQILVPEPVFVPNGEQLASGLIQALLRGPDPRLTRVSRSFIPPGLTFGLSVPVSADGVADISLKGDAGQQTPQAIELMLAQLAWTLHQEPTINALRVSIGGQQLQLPGGASEVSVNQGSEYDPTGFQASSLLYGLRDGRLVSGPRDALEPVDGPFGTEEYGLVSIGVNLNATRVAGVSGSGTSVLVGPVRGPAADVVQVASRADGLLPPAWDFADRLWLVDRGEGHARVSYVDEHRPQPLRVPGVSGEDVRSFLVSRDGSRLVAVVRRRSGDALMVSRIRHDDQGHVLRATAAHRIAWEGATRLRIRDIAWRTPTTVAVLLVLTDQLAQVRTISVDGSPPGADGLSTTLRGQVLALVGSPVLSEGLYAVTRSGLIDLSNTEQGNTTLDPRVSMLDYVG